MLKFSLVLLTVLFYSINLLHVASAACSSTLHITNCAILKKQESVNVKQFGAKGDGKTDDSQAIQKAIDFAKTNKRGTVVFPNGRYRLSKGGIVVRQGVLLKGLDKMPAKSGFGSDLCQFEITFGKNNPNAPAFTMESFSGIAGFSFFYPEQLFKLSAPIVYGWTITTNGSASQDAITLRNLMMTNSYQGIHLDNGGQHTLENIYGQPIKVGIFVDRQYDVLRINNIHFWPFYSQQGQPLYDWIESNGDAIVLNRTDGLQGTNWFVYGYRRGLHLKNSGSGAPWLTVNNVLFDVCREPIFVDAINYLTLNNVTLTGSNVATSQSGIYISEKVNDLNSIIQINGFTAVNFVNSFHNKGLCTITVSMKSKIYDGKNNGVRWYDIVNENDKALINATIPLESGDNYKRIAGKIQINGAYSYKDLIDITPPNFNDLSKWGDSKGAIQPITSGSRLNLIGDISVASYLLPSSVRNTPGVYLLEMTLQEYSNTGSLGLSLFYPRLRDYPNKIDFCITPYLADPYFAIPTVIKIPFVVGTSDIYLDFVFGRASNTSKAYIDVKNLKLYKAVGTQANYKEMMPKYQSYK